MAFKLPKLDRTFPVVEETRVPTIAFQIWWQQVVDAIQGSINAIEDALAAAGIALDAAADAQAAAAAATAAAEAGSAVSKLSGSGVTGLTITGTDAGSNASVTITDHIRVYSDGSTVPVIGAPIPGLAYSTTYYIYYDDPGFVGGTVSYQTTTTQATAVQTGNRHLVGQVTTPAALGAATPGLKPRPPGFSQLEA